MPATFGLDLVALTFAAAGAQPAVCPAGFEIAATSANAIECHRAVTSDMARDFARTAGRVACPTPDYWNFGPHVVTADRDGGAVVRWVCYHLQG